MKSAINFFKRETVFCVSLVLALLSMLLVRPDAVYLTYPDYRTLALLFCLMTIVEGLRSLGVFDQLGRLLIQRAGSMRRLSLIMVMLCFFSSMIITNDVALITFVPFTLLVLAMAGGEKQLLRLVVLETIAANLGSMATPIGNPQNLYLTSISGLSMADFFRAVLPYAGLALLMLVGIVMLERDTPLQSCLAKDGREAEPMVDGSSRRSLAVYVGLLMLCLLVVFRVLPYGVALVCVLAAVLVLDRRIFRRVDYFLLLTFLCFFIFVGNIKRIPAVNGLLVSLVQGHELYAGILASQAISNVPAAILLSGFTERYDVLLTAVNLGGLGTLIASLASLISFKFFVRSFPQQKGAFLKAFTGWNLLFLAALTMEAVLLT